MSEEVKKKKLMFEQILSASNSKLVPTKSDEKSLVSPQSPRFNTERIQRNKTVTIDDEKGEVVFRNKDNKNSLRVSVSGLTDNASSAKSKTMRHSLQYVTKAQYEEQIQELMDQLQSERNARKLVENELVKAKVLDSSDALYKGNGKKDNSGSQENYPLNNRIPDLMNGKLENSPLSSPSTERNTSVMSEFACEMKNLIYRQRAIERELETTISNNLQIASKVERLQLQLQVYQEEKQRRYSDSTPPPQGEVTLVFTDVQGSTSQWEKDPLTMATALRLHNVIIRRNLRKYGGYEVKTEGDAFMIAFSSAMNSLLWCVETQLDLVNAQWPEKLFENPESSIVIRDDKVVYRGLRVRMGLHAGTPSCEIDPVTGRMDYFGPMVNRSARIEGISQGGQILISGAVWDKVKDTPERMEITVIDLGEYRLRGLETSTKLVQVLPTKLKDRTFILPKASLTGELVSESEILRHDNLALINRLEELKCHFTELQNVASKLLSRAGTQENVEGNISSILKELEKVVKEQTLLQDKIQKVEFNNEILSNKVLDLNKSMVSDCSQVEKLEEIMTTKRDEISLTEQRTALRKAVNESQIRKQELKIEIEEINQRLMTEVEGVNVSLEIKETLEQRVNNLAAKLDQFFNERSVLEEKLKIENEEKLTALNDLKIQKKIVKGLKGEVTELQIQVEEKRRAINLLKKEGKLFQKKIITDLSSVQTERRELTEQVMNLKVDVERLKRKMRSKSLTPISSKSELHDC